MGRACYAERVAQAATRFEAADLARAMGCYCAAHIHQTDEERLRIVEEYEGYAQALERDYALNDGDEPLSEDEHPWRQWILDWGFTR